ncbi:MAG: lysophospholipid acyltransferase family protein [Actinomycetota bacterium]
MSERHADGKDAAFKVDSRRTFGYVFARGIIMGVARVLFRPKVISTFEIPATGGVLVAPIHRSNVDFAFPVLLTRRKMFFMAKDSLWKVSLLGRFLIAMGGFPVHRESADRASLQRAEEVLARGEVLILFPEGTRQEGPLVAELHEGAAYLASKTQSIIIPVGIAESDRAMPKGAKLPRPVRVTVFAGAPLQPAPLGATGKIQRSAVKASTAELSAALQIAFDAAKQH